MTETEAIRLFKCLADATRLQILKSLHAAPMYVERLAQRLGRSPSTVSFHLKKLEEAGVVIPQRDQYYTVYSLCPTLLNTRILDLICEPSGQESAQEEREKLYRDKVLESFFVYGKLQSIPVQRKKKRIILEKLVENFTPGRVYKEKEINLILAEYHDDFCTLRRDMISEHLMERGNGLYWRVDTPAPLRDAPAETKEGDKT